MYITGQGAVYGYGGKDFNSNYKKEWLHTIRSNLVE